MLRRRRDRVEPDFANVIVDLPPHDVAHRNTIGFRMLSSWDEHQDAVRISSSRKRHIKLAMGESGLRQVDANTIHRLTLCPVYRHGIRGQNGKLAPPEGEGERRGVGRGDCQTRDVRR